MISDPGASGHWLTGHLTELNPLQVRSIAKLYGTIIWDMSINVAPKRE